MTTSASGRLVASNIVPPTQNTAPVLEFRCLYTSDLRRKQKRWQDGRLKFHTFNKRIMVYDDRGNFVGDTHWREDYTLEEGEEVELERSGILVQLAECVGKRDQDLTELLDKRIKEREERLVARRVVSSPSQKLIHLAQTRSVEKNPSEQPQQNSVRQKTHYPCAANKSGYAQTLTGATLTLSAKPAGEKSIRYDPSWFRKLRQPIESVDLSDGGNTYPAPRGIVSTTLYSADESQAEANCKSLSDGRGSSCYARNYFGATLALGGDNHISNKISSNVERQDDPLQLPRSLPTPISISDGEFTDIDTYDKLSTKVRQEKIPSSTHECLLPIEVKNVLPAGKFGVKSAPSLQAQYFTPLRIKPRPKRKLLIVACPQSYASSVTETAEDVDQITESPAYKSRSSQPPFPKAMIQPNASCDAQEQLLNLRMKRKGPPMVAERIRPPPKGAGIDHYTIDAILAQNHIWRENEANLERHREVACNMNRYYLTTSEKSEKLHQTTEREEVISITPAITKVVADQHSEYEMNAIQEEKGSLLIVDHSILESQGETAGLLADYEETSTSADGEPSTLRAGRTAVRADAAGDLGPWSREAFDLFDWHPRVIA